MGTTVVTVVAVVTTLVANGNHCLFLVTMVAGQLADSFPVSCLTKIHRQTF